MSGYAVGTTHKVAFAAAGTDSVQLSGNANALLFGGDAAGNINAFVKFSDKATDGLLTMEAADGDGMLYAFSNAARQSLQVGVGHQHWMYLYADGAIDIYVTELL